MKNDYIICLAAGSSQLPLILEAKGMGYRVIAIDRNENAPGFRHTDIRILQSTYESDKVLAELRSLRNRCSFSGLIARTSGPALRTAAAIAEEFHLPGLRREIIPLATEKSRLREFCSCQGIPMPRGQRTERSDDLDPALSLPLIVKPDLTMTGKKDVSVVSDLTAVKQAVEAAVRSSGNGCAEVEEYVEGFDVSALFLLRHGQATVIRLWDELIAIMHDRAIRGIGVSVPSVVEGNEAEKKIQQTVGLFSRHFTAVDALMILSFRIDRSGNPFVIELHGDLGGDLIADVLLPTAIPGFNFFHMVLEAAAGKPVMPIEAGITPTCLLYDGGTFPDAMARNAATCGNALFFQEGSVGKNLDRMNAMLEGSEMTVLTRPMHGTLLESQRP